MTLVSIITPSYNQAAYLEVAIRSVLGQDHPQIEYLIIDGGSTDGSVEIIKKFGDRLAWWVSEPDSGQADAINKGFVRTHGEIVAWLNSDDYYLPDAISHAVTAFSLYPDTMMIHGDALAVDEQGRTINRLSGRQLSLEDLLCFQIINQPAVFVRRSAWEKAGKLDASLHFLLDHQFWIRLASMGSIRHIPQYWAAARFHAAAKNRARALDFGNEASKILVWAGQDPVLAPILANVSHRARASAQRFNARYYLDGGRAWQALKSWTHAFWLHPHIIYSDRTYEWALHRRADRNLRQRSRFYPHPPYPSLQ